MPLHDFFDNFQDSGYIVDRRVECGLPGKKAWFELGHAWGSAEDPKESSVGGFWGVRENVDPAVVTQFQLSHPGLNISLDRWQTKKEIIHEACFEMARRVEYYLQDNPHRVEKTLLAMKENGHKFQLVFPEYEHRIGIDSCTRYASELGEDSEFLLAWQSTLEKELSRLFECVSRKSYTVTFGLSRDNKPIARVAGKIAFPENNFRPKIGETWQVKISGQNSRHTVFYLRPVKKCG